MQKKKNGQAPLGSKYEPLAALISAWAQSQRESLEAFKKAAEAEYQEVCL